MLEDGQVNYVDDADGEYRRMARETNNKGSINGLDM